MSRRDGLRRPAGVGLAAMLVLALPLLSAGRGVAVSDAPVGGVVDHTARRGDTWVTLGARYGVDPAPLAASNGQQPGTRIIKAREGLARPVAGTTDASHQ